MDNGRIKPEISRGSSVMNLSRASLKKIDEITSSKKFIGAIAPVIQYLPISRVHKNILKVKEDASRGSREVKSYPYKMVINITNQCNLRCNFCEITYLHQKYPQHYSNQVDVDTFEKFSPIIENLYSLEFFGNVGEPLTNPDFMKIVRYVKQNFGARIFLNTNGTLLNPGISSSMVENKLDEVLVSLHAATEKVYEKLIGGTFQQVVENIKTLTTIKEEYRDKKPEVGIAFALNQVNAEDKENIIELTAKLHADYLQISHYYHGQNKLDRDISFREKPAVGNAELDFMYSFAKLYSNIKRKKVSLRPKDPPYLGNDAKLCNEPKHCEAPWSTIKFDGCIEHQNSHYVAVCNRINLFRINYTEFNFTDFHLLWNHPYFQYIRATVNSIESNPICRFCKNPETAILRNTNNEEYRKQRDKAVKDFFEHADAHSTISNIKGIYLIKENPYGGN